MVYIYTLECPINHVVIYVGKTINLKERYHSHCTPNKRKGGKLYGYLKHIKNNNLKPILEVIDSTEDINWSWLEQYWISQFKTWGFNLLNVTNGGEKQYHFNHTEETKKIISEKQLGKKLSKEWCDNISKGKKGVKFSDKHIINLSESHKNNSVESCWKSVYQLDDNFNILNKFDSITFALKFINHNDRSGSISRVCNGKFRTAYGYRWCYTEDYDNLNTNKFKRITKKIVLKIDPKTEEIIKTYNSIKDAECDNNTSRGSISHVCNEKHGSVKGYIFLFEKDYSVDLIKNVKKTINTEYFLEMIDLKTKELIRTFSSIKEAQLELNIKHISCVCSGNRNHAGGYFWKKQYL